MEPTRMEPTRLELMTRHIDSLMAECDKLKHEAMIFEKSYHAILEERDILREALGKYGTHSYSDFMCEASKHDDYKCNCGFDAAIGAE